MCISRRSTLILLYSIFLHHIICTIAATSPAPYSPVDNIAVNCGASGKSTSVDGRAWIGDVGSKFAPFQQPKSKSITSKAIHRASHMVNPIPYMTARLSRSQFFYTFQVSPGPKFIRLHFYPASYPGFERSKAFFAVKAGPYTLLSNFSASLTADALGLNSLAKEFCVNVEENQALSITFSPSPTSTSDCAYAFINGIEIVSMPTGLYYNSDSGVYIVGQKYRISIDNRIALEMVHRLNIGGISISSVEDSGMFRRWSEDSGYLLESGVIPVSNTIPVKYKNLPTCTAPPKVYQTAWSMDPNQQANQVYSFTWKLPVDLGFRYLIRLHFCEFEYRMKEGHHREFSIFINNQIAEAQADLIKWNGENGVAMYRDYMVTMEGDRLEGKRDVFIALYHHYELRNKQSDGILKGLEVFKLSNPDNNLAGANPLFLVHAPTTNSNTPKRRNLVFAFGGVNTMATGLVILLTLLNVTVYQLRIWGENNGKRSISSSSTKEFCRRFSVHEIQLATNNFDDALVIGHGGFGEVYKGLIDDGATTVAIKRLNLKSNQGAHEFWTEVEMLSKLRHTHLVALIGYCNDFQEMILVYEYMAHGTLADHLYKICREGNGISNLTWEQRLNICIGAARGLDYLHRGTQPGIIHRDVKTTNILLDEKWVAKISDFGLSKIDTTSQSHTHVSTDVKGTFGYLDPDYFLTRRLTWKTDVYAFGVVLLEVLCGRPAVDIRLEEEQQSLCTWAKHCINDGTLDQIIDPALGREISRRCLKLFVETATKCLHNSPNARPTMFDVVRSLEFALLAQDRRIDSSKEIEEEEDIVRSLQFALVPRGHRSDSSIETEEEEDNDFINVDVGEADYEHGADLRRIHSKKKNKLTISKMVQSIAFRAKGMDMPKGKTNESNVDDASDYEPSCGWPLYPLFLQKARSTKLNPLPIRREELRRHLSMAQIEAVTNNFDATSIVGHGGSGIVYKGYLEDESLVVVKWILKPLLLGCEFWDQIQMLPKLQHPHLVPLVGYFPYKCGVVLVSDLMASGSLHDHLYGCDGEGYNPLAWRQRLRICIDAARGIHYLHTGWERKIIHPRLKTTKILLDERGAGRVSDFGLPDSRPNDDLYRTSVYAAPEYLHGLLTDKSNVYSFGIVLLEVLSAREEALYLRPADGRTRLLHWASGSIDPYLIGKIAPECLRKFVEIAESCLQFKWRERPSIGDVVERLEHALQLQEDAEVAEQDVKLGD